MTVKLLKIPVGVSLLFHLFGQQGLSAQPKGEETQGLQVEIEALEQGQLWNRHDQLYAHQQASIPKDLETYAQAFDLNLTIVRDCLESKNHGSKIRNDLAEGKGQGQTTDWAR